MPPDLTWLMTYLFNEVLDGRNETLADGVREALGRPPREFADYAGRPRPPVFGLAGDSQMRFRGDSGAPKMA